MAVLKSIEKRRGLQKGKRGCREGPFFLTSEKGLSLVEVLFAAVVLGIAVVSVPYMFGTAGQNIGRLGDERVCLAVAQQEMEHILSLPYSLIVDGSKRFRRPPDPTTQDPDGDLFVQWDVTPILDDPHGMGHEYKLIVLDLYDRRIDNGDWQGTTPVVTPEERVVTLTTFVAP
jgi:hypothetical protein